VDEDCDRHGVSALFGRTDCCLEGVHHLRAEHSDDSAHIRLSYCLKLFLVTIHKKNRNMVSLPISTTRRTSYQRNNHLVWEFGKLPTAAQHLTLSLSHIPKWYERSLQSTIECHQQDALKQFIKSCIPRSEDSAVRFIKIVFKKLGGPACGRLSYSLDTLDPTLKRGSFYP